MIFELGYQCAAILVVTEYCAPMAIGGVFAQAFAAERAFAHAIVKGQAAADTHGLSNELYFLPARLTQRTVLGHNDIAMQALRREEEVE